MSVSGEIVALAGTWLYDGAVESPVFIIRLNRDYWFELAKAHGFLDEGEVPQLNEHGYLYYVRFGDEGESPFSLSVGFMSCEEAVRWAESKSPSPIRWYDQDDGEL
ncbi:MAG: hypothetical protein JSU95_08845 [Betaproteobacteria bacterium]|nr:MAG: hypothetical protein JSU95_08845 [Betaproteobacteria bacterium]